MQNTKQIMYHAANGCKVELLRKEFYGIYPIERVNLVSSYLTTFNVIDGTKLYSAMLSEINICLRDLSQLTEEITHNGETFVPIVKICEKFQIYGKINEHGVFGWNVPTGGDDCQDYYLKYNPTTMQLEECDEIGEPFGWQTYCSFGMFEQLLSWQFNCFQLTNIKQVNNEFNPYK